MPLQYHVGAGGTLLDGSDDMFIHCKQLVDTEGLQQGITVSHDTKYFRKYRASNCTVTSSGGGGDDGAFHTTGAGRLQDVRNKG